MCPNPGLTTLVKKKGHKTFTGNNKRNNLCKEEVDLDLSRGTFTAGGGGGVNENWAAHTDCTLPATKLCSASIDAFISDQKIDITEMEIQYPYIIPISIILCHQSDMFFNLQGNIKQNSDLHLTRFLEIKIHIKIWINKIVSPLHGTHFMNHMIQFSS